MKIGKRTTFYVYSVINKLVMLLVFRYLSRQLDVSEFGLIEFLRSLLILLPSLYVLYGDSVISKLIVTTQSELTLAKLLNNNLLVASLLSLIGHLCYVMHSTLPMSGLISVTSLLISQLLVYKTWYNCKSSPDKAIKVDLVVSTVGLLLTLVLFELFSSSLMLRIGALFIANVIAFIFIYIKENSLFKFDIILLKRQLIMSLPLLPVLLLGWLSGEIDRLYFVKRDLEVLANLAVVVTIVRLYFFVHDTLFKVNYGQIINNIREEYCVFTGSYLRLSHSLLLLFWCVIILFWDYVISLISSDVYSPAIVFVPIYILNQYVQIFLRPMALKLLLTKETYHTTISQVVRMIFTMGTIFLFANYSLMWVPASILMGSIAQMIYVSLVLSEFNIKYVSFDKLLLLLTMYLFSELDVNRTLFFSLSGLYLVVDVAREFYKSKKIWI